MRKIKLAVVGATASMGGCIAGGWWWDFLWNAAINVGTDFVTDNDAVFDIWEDGNVVE
ncbi:MAG: hypothetical protein ACYTHJ_23280 [Planctomycetota bacterium]|jgi:hypothetical protein